MQVLLDNLKNNREIHHAYLITGDISVSLKNINSAMEKIIGRDFISNPDYYFNKTEVFDIDDSRRLRSISQKRSINGKRFFVIVANSFLEKAQNALLKTLEEPISGNHFFIITEDDRQLLFTVRSRLKKVHNYYSDIDEKLSELCFKFLSSNKIDRLLMLENILNKDIEPRAQRLEVKNFLNFLQNFVFKKYKEGKFKFNKNIIEELEGISISADYAKDSSSSLGLLLEYVSFICPKLSEEDFCGEKVISQVENQIPK